MQKDAIEEVFVCALGLFPNALAIPTWAAIGVSWLQQEPQHFAHLDLCFFL